MSTVNYKRTLGLSAWMKIPNPESESPNVRMR